MDGIILRYGIHENAIIGRWLCPKGESNATEWYIFMYRSSLALTANEKDCQIYEGSISLGA